MIKSLLHKTARSFGFDIVNLANLDAEVENRIRQRERSRLEKMRRLREQTRQAAASGARSTEGLLWVSREEIEVAATSRMQDVQTLLDIGCAFRPQQRFRAQIHLCCEPYHEYMDRLMVETASDSRYVYLQLDLKQVCDTFPCRSVDSAYLCDVIEHVDRDIADACLEKLRNIVRKQIILFTPLGYMPQDPSEAASGTDPWGMGGTHWQKHRSGWTPDDFPASEGWTVIACKDFHQEDGYGRPLEEPFGAMWAIYNAAATEGEQ